jgi:hypothetical protein
MPHCSPVGSQAARACLPSSLPPSRSISEAGFPFKLRSRLIRERVPGADAHVGLNYWPHLLGDEGISKLHKCLSCPVQATATSYRPIPASLAPPCVGEAMPIRRIAFASLPAASRWRDFEASFGGSSTAIVATFGLARSR